MKSEVIAATLVGVVAVGLIFILNIASGGHYKGCTINAEDRHWEMVGKVMEHVPEVKTTCGNFDTDSTYNDMKVGNVYDIDINMMNRVTGVKING